MSLCAHSDTSARTILLGMRMYVVGDIIYVYLYMKLEHMHTYVSIIQS